MNDSRENVLPSIREASSSHARPPHATAALVLEDGTVFWGRGLGATGETVGEVCFNTAMTGYQEIMTDPSYAGQIINFTFPHIGNVGANLEDIEATAPFARGLVLRADITQPSSWRASRHLDDWLVSHGLPGLSGVDTRALTHRIRDGGAPRGAIRHDPEGAIDIEALWRAARDWPGLEGMDLAREVSCLQTYHWEETSWRREGGYGRLSEPRHRVVAVDYGAKRNILRSLAELGCAVTVVPATATVEDILQHDPDGVFLSNGPGDPAATADYAVPTLKGLLERDLPVFGICLGHQLLCLTFGARTAKMHLGHRGGNHPVKDLETGKVEITSQNHGFAVERASLPETVVETHVSLFDDSNEGMRAKGRPVFSVQYHPEASPGPHDSNYLFRRFIAAMAERKR